MAVKAETIEQIGGFGNLIPSSYKEHFRSSGFIKSSNGLVAGIKSNLLISTYGALYPQYSGSLEAITSITDGLGNYSTSSGGIPMTYFLSENGQLFGAIEDDVPQLLYDFNKGANPRFSNNGGMIFDQKGRLLVSGSRYLSLYEPANNTSFIASVTFTNGSSIITAPSGTFDVGWVGKKIRVTIGSSSYIYELFSWTSSSQMYLYDNFIGASGSYPIRVLTNFNESFKDWGTSIYANSEDNAQYTPTETYEDTVLFGRGNNITSINITTDTITTDAIPAFTMPQNYDCIGIHAGSNGILLGYNFQGKGVLLLWDNFSDRSIAPWIRLSGRIVSMCKYNGNWIVITTKEIIVTNGYSVSTVIESFLNAEHSSYAPLLTNQTSFVDGNDLYCILDFSLNGKRRAGLYKIDLVSKFCYFIPRYNLDQYNSKSNCLFYSNKTGNSQIYIGYTDGIGSVSFDDQASVSSFVSNPVGSGVNRKIAEALKVDLGISETYYSSDSPFSFDIIAKVFPMTKQKQNIAKLKTAMVTNYNKMTIDETVYPQIPIGSEIEFLSGENAGYTRNVISKTGAGTNTAVLTLDRVLPNLQTNTTDYFFFNPFLLIEKKTYTNITEIPETIWFDIKNKIKGKKFMFKIEIENPTVPIELRPMTFIYDDLGVL